jgi:hypothetical protein
MHSTQERLFFSRLGRGRRPQEQHDSDQEGRPVAPCTIRQTRPAGNKPPLTLIIDTRDR